jgi:hypothetical protein
MTSQHAEISIQSLEHFRDEFLAALNYVPETLAEKIRFSIEIIEECLEEPLFDGYLS